MPYTIRAEVLDDDGKIIFTAVVPEVRHNELYNQFGSFGVIEVLRALQARLHCAQ